MRSLQGCLMMARKLLLRDDMRTLLLTSTLLCSGCLFLSPIEEGEGPNQEENLLLWQMSIQSFLC
jgi:hypothetical protein